MTGLSDQLAAEDEPSLARADRAARPEGMSIHQWIAQPACAADPDIIGFIGHEAIIHATIYACIASYLN